MYTEPFGGRTNFTWTPSGEYKSLDADMGSDPDFAGIDTAWKRSTFTPSGLYERGVGGIGTAPISKSQPRSSSGLSQYGSDRSSRGVKSLGADVSYLTPTMAKPTMGALPEYIAPTMDKARISELTEIGMGAPMGKLRSGLNRALVESRYSSNPNVRALQKKSALAGYGTGISDVRLGAHKAAMGEYMPEFQAATQKAGAEYRGGLNRMNLQFQADMNEYLKTMQRTSTKVPSGQVTSAGAGGALSNTEEMRQRMANIIPYKTIPYAP